MVYFMCISLCTGLRFIIMHVYKVVDFSPIAGLSMDQAALTYCVNDR
jgi:hypothetical protein